MDNRVEQRLFLPRPGEDVKAYVELLTSPPEFVLDKATKDRVIAFEASLFEGEYADRAVDIVLPSGERPSFKDLLELVAKTDRVTTAYFLTEEGKAAAAEAGLEDIAAAGDEQELSRLFARYSFDGPQKLTKDLLGGVNKWVRNRCTDAILNDEPFEEYPEAYFLHNPQDFALKVRGMLAYAAFLRGVKRDLKDEGDTPEVLAKQAIVEIYQARINASLASEYSTLLGFTHQVRQLPPEYGRQWNEWLGTDFSARLRLLITEREMTPRFAKRLDALRSGLAEGYGDGHPYRGVSETLLRFFEREVVQDVISDPIFTPEEVELLSRVEVDTATMQSWLEDVLKERDLLSEYPYDVEKDRFRRGRAPDGKWQIEPDPGTDSLAVDKIKGTIKLSTDFNRTLTSVDPVGAVPVGAHELKHVEQNELSYRNPHSLRLTQEDKGKRAILLREASGIAQEREVHAKLFGQHRPNNPHYMRALVVFEETGDETAATKAYVESVLNGRQLDDLPEKQRRSIVYKAVDRVRRLTRREGGFNTQPLVYAEQAVVTEEVIKLPIEVQELIFAEASLDLPDMVRLHRFGLLEIGKQTERPLPDIFIEKVLSIMKDKVKELRS